MSLNFDLTGIDDYENKCWVEGDPAVPSITGQRLHPRTEKIIFLTMYVGLPTITATNLVEFATRVEMYQVMFEDSTEYITLGDLRAHIGLSTNVSKETSARWRNRMAKCLYNEKLSQMKRANQACLEGKDG